MDLITDSDIARVREFVGTGDEYSDDDLWSLLLDNDSPEAVAQTIISTRLADLLASPASFSVPGYSESNTANIVALKEKLSELQIITGTSPSAITEFDLIREGPSSRW
jgi:hypothetical protein